MFHDTCNYFAYLVSNSLHNPNVFFITISNIFTPASLSWMIFSTKWERLMTLNQTFSPPCRSYLRLLSVCNPGSVALCIINNSCSVQTNKSIGPSPNCFLLKKSLRVTKLLMHTINKHIIVDKFQPGFHRLQQKRLFLESVMVFCCTVMMENDQCWCCWSSVQHLILWTPGF